MKNIIVMCLFSLIFFSCDKDVTAPEIVCGENYSKIIDYDDIYGNECYFNEDIDVLQDFIENSGSSLNVEQIDRYNINGSVEWYELGYQIWSFGRLKHFSTYWSDNSGKAYNCNLSGSIPSSISNWLQINYLYLGYHPISTVPEETLTGSIPGEIGDLINLEKLFLHSNSLSGKVPDIFSDLTNLNEIWLDNNELTGQLPESLWSLTDLEKLYLEHNNLSGQISSSIGNLTSLQHFWINNNSLSGVLPDELFTLNNLIKLKINHNSFEGNIPSNIGNLSNLEVVDFSYNNFEGLISENICDLSIDFGGSWSDLYYLYDISNFGVTDNYFCPDSETSLYPVCIQNFIGNQTIDNCINSSYSSIPLPEPISHKKSTK